MSEQISWTNVIRRLGDLQPWERNPRQIREEQAARLRDSFNAFGQVEPIAIGPSDEVYNGHQRLNVLMAQYGPEYEIECRQASRALSEREREKLTVYLHKGAAGEWDFDVLANEFDVADLLDWGFEAFELGIEEPEPEPGADTEPQVDRAEELRQEWGVESGQLWQLGEHRLICGDCTDAAVVERVMDGKRANSLIYDPPWDTPQLINGEFSGTLAFCDGFTLGNVTTMFGPPTWVFVWDCVSCWYTPNRPLRRMKMAAWYGDVTDYDFDGWHYGDAGEPRTVWNTRGEYEFRPDSRGKHLSDCYVEPITKLHANSEHSHSKPIDWITLLIGNCTSGLVFDPFLGSGTTIIACENLGRKCRAIEISAAYTAVALQRWADHTGQTPVLVE